jgi:hypothetical protein
MRVIRHSPLSQLMCFTLVVTVTIMPAIAHAGPCGTSATFPEVRSGYGNVGTCVKIVSGGGSPLCGWLAADPTPCTGTYTKTPQDCVCAGPDSTVCEYGTTSNDTIAKTQETYTRNCITTPIYNQFGQIVDVTCACHFNWTASQQILVKKCKICPYGT